MHHRLLGLEERAHVISLRLWFEGNIKHALRPSLGRPSLALSEIVDGSPVCQSYHLVEFHSKEVFSHGSHRCLTLVEVHPRESLAVAGEIHIPIIIRLNISHLGKVARQGVGLPVAVAGMHGHGHLTCGVVSLYEGLHEFVLRHTPVVERSVVI